MRMFDFTRRFRSHEEQYQLNQLTLFAQNRPYKLHISPDKWTKHKRMHRIQFHRRKQFNFNSNDPKRVQKRYVRGNQRQAMWRARSSRRLDRLTNGCDFGTATNWTQLWTKNAQYSTHAPFKPRTRCLAQFGWRSVATDVAALRLRIEAMSQFYACNQDEWKH